MTSDHYPDEEGLIVLLRTQIDELRAALDDARYCISKHQGGCILGCWEATEVAPDDQ